MKDKIAWKNWLALAFYSWGNAIPVQVIDGRSDVPIFFPVCEHKGFTNGRNVNDAFHTDELTDRTARGSSFLADNSLNGTLTSTMSESLLNKFSFELAQRQVVARTQRTSGPGILIAGTALFGTPYSGNDRRFETHTEFADTVALQLRRQHLLQLGGRADHVALRTRVPDGSQGLFVFSNLAALQNDTPDFFTQSFGNFDTNLGEIRFAGFAQDHWTASSSLRLDYGLRYEYNRLPSLFPQNALNFSPRLGVARTPLKDTIIRSGFGIFYDRFELATINRISEFDGRRADTQIVEDTDAANLYRSSSILSIPLAGVAPSIWTAQPGLRNSILARLRVLTRDLLHLCMEDSTCTLLFRVRSYLHSSSLPRLVRASRRNLLVNL